METAVRYFAVNLHCQVEPILDGLEMLAMPR